MYSILKYTHHYLYHAFNFNIISQYFYYSVGGNATLSRLEKSSAKFIKDSLLSCLNLQDHPRLMIYIKVCVLRDDGGMLSVALNAAAIALLDSGNSFFYCILLFYFFIYFISSSIFIHFICLLSDVVFTFCYNCY